MDKKQVQTSLPLSFPFFSIQYHLVLHHCLCSDPVKVACATHRSVTVGWKGTIENFTDTTLVTIHFNILSKVYHLTGTSCLGTHLGVDSLDILPLGNSTLVGTKTPLGKFINSLISGTSSSFDHIKDSPFVRGKATNLTGNFTAESSALAKFL